MPDETQKEINKNVHESMCEIKDSIKEGFKEVSVRFDKVDKKMDTIVEKSERRHEDYKQRFVTKDLLGKELVYMENKIKPALDMANEYKADKAYRLKKLTDIAWKLATIVILGYLGFKKFL